VRPRLEHCLRANAGLGVGSDTVESPSPVSGDVYLPAVLSSLSQDVL
jgi:hypothetical protein